MVFTTSATSGPSGSQVSGGAAEPSGRVTGRAAVLHRAREAGHDQLEQGVHADAAQRGGEEHREEVRPGDGGLQVGDQVVLDQLVAGEVALHERLVLALADDALDQLGAEAVGVGRLDAGVQQRDHAAHRAVGPRSTRCTG